ncbi:hypothetical protein CSW42_05475 [Thermus scotoductus]|nr:hypothetical protein CSW42_05475 [Thermus scotoductus]
MEEGGRLDDGLGLEVAGDSFGRFPCDFRPGIIALIRGGVRVPGHTRGVPDLPIAHPFIIP